MGQILKQKKRRNQDTSNSFAVKNQAPIPIGLLDVDSTAMHAKVSFGQAWTALMPLSAMVLLQAQWKSQTMWSEESRSGSKSPIPPQIRLPLKIPTLKSEGTPS
jgi:hypothetical protein